MKLFNRLFLLSTVCLPMIGAAMSEQTENAIASTKAAAKQWEQVAKDKFHQGEEAAKRNWPKIKQKSQQEFDAAKRKWQQTPDKSQ